LLNESEQALPISLKEKLQTVTDQMARLPTEVVHKFQAALD